MPSDSGSVASARALPESTVRKSVQRVALALHHASELALAAAPGQRPAEGAAYIVETLDELEREIRLLRRVRSRLS